MNEFAANSGEELTYLRAVIRQLDSIAPKNSYVDWLVANNQTARADFLRKTIHAHGSLAAEDLPDFASVDACWSRMIGATYLRALIEHASELGHEQQSKLRDRIFRLAEPSIIVRYSERDADPSFNPDVGQSRYFGDPDMPKGIQWPTYGDCEHDFEDTDGTIPLDSPCFFACQIRTRDLRPMVAGELANVDKMWYFFTFCETESLGSQSVCVLNTEDLDRLQPQKQPTTAHEDNLAVEGRQIHFTEALSLPESYGSVFRNELALDEFGASGSDIYEKVVDAGRIPFDRELCNGLPMFGYLQASSGDDPSPTTEHRRFILVRCSLDAGIVHLGIDARSLNEQAWEASTLVWNDWDS